MEKTTVTAERVFSQAIALPPGAARDQWVAAHCGENPALRQEVESLLRAHDAAGDFLDEPSGPERNPPLAVRRALLSSSADMNAAAQAAVFLRDMIHGNHPAAEDYLAGLPPELRQETRERILAGLRARQMCAPIEPTNAEREEPPPHLPGFRLERKLGEGGLGVVKC